MLSGMKLWVLLVLLVSGLIILFAPIPFIYQEQVLCSPCDPTIPRSQCLKCPQKGDIGWGPSLFRRMIWGINKLQYESRMVPPPPSTISIDISPTDVVTPVTPTRIVSYLLPTTGWETADIGTLVIRYPDNLYTMEKGERYIQLRRRGNVGNDMSGSPSFLLADDYRGENAQEWYLKHYGYYASEIGKNLFFSKKGLGGISVVEVSLVKGNVNDILIIGGKNLVDVRVQNADLKTVETIVSTVLFRETL